MGEESFDRAVDQAILAIKKGAHLLKCGRRGKPKFCPFRLSTDEKHLIWYSGQREKQLRMSSVAKIIPGQRTVNFQRNLQSDKECQSFSLIYANGERSLDLICKDKGQADSWFVGLKIVISRNHQSTLFNGSRSRRGVQSCVSSPAGYFRRKSSIGLLEDVAGYSQVRSVCGSPTHSLSEKSFHDGLSYSSESFYTSESGLSQMQNIIDILIPNSPCINPHNLKKRRSSLGSSEFQNNMLDQFLSPAYGSQVIEKNDVLKDVMIWGEGIAGGVLGGGFDIFGSHNVKQADALLPKVLESTMMLDVHSMSLGGKHAGLVTKQGEVFCWGEGNGGRLGHKVNMDSSHPKIVDSLNGIHVKSISCGEYHTCALTHSGELYTWGDNGCSTNISGEERKRNGWWPHKLSGPLDGISISIVACGEWHTAVVSTSGQLFTYGDGTFGVLGHGNLQSVSQPKEVESLKGLFVKSVACGSWHTAAIVEIIADRCKYKNSVGKLFTWGDGDKGRLGHADAEKKILPTCVAQLVDHDFVQVCCGRMLTVGLTDMGVVYTMGSAVHGQLGNPNAKDKSVTVVEGKLKGECVKEISSGSYHIAVLTSRGSVYMWGKGLNGQLGLGDFEDRNLPTCVEALRDRQVESIACGSNITAAICLHKSVSICDQSACKGCKLPFGFTRKKHNCYNCGLLFCRACSSKKVSNASLAPDKSKPSRVCEPCFNHLQRLTQSGRLLKLENRSPRQLLSTQNPYSDGRDDCGEESLTGVHLSSTVQCWNADSQSRERMNQKKQEEKQQRIETVSSFSVQMPRWGQVQCPRLFETEYSKNNNTALVPFYQNQLSSANQVCTQSIRQVSEPSVSSTMNAGQDGPESDRMLAEEVQKLRAEAMILEQQCQIGSKKLQECQERIEVAWAVARDEAAKCKAAKEIIKALALQLHSRSDKVSTGKLPKDGLNATKPQISPIRTESCAPEGLLPAPAGMGTPLLSEVTLPRDRQVESLCGSPIVFSNTLKSVNGKDTCNDKARSVDDMRVVRTDGSQPNGTKTPKHHEWVEQYEPGVYITFTHLPSGQKGLKRVRFSRKRYSEKEATRWWEENQAVVYQKYDIEGYSNSN